MEFKKNMWNRKVPHVKKRLPEMNGYKVLIDKSRQTE
jgi:hypothetical protein